MKRPINLQFNAENFYGLHTDMLSSLDGIRGKQVVVVVGMTGAGKSTTLNYLSGFPMKEVESGARIGYDVDDMAVTSAHIAKVGHGATSETLYPAAYPVANNSFVLLDTAGLGDNRGENVALCISLGLKRVSEVALVKGIVVVLPEEAIIAPRATGIRELFKLIGELTSGSKLSSNNVSFCVTRSQCKTSVADANHIAKLLQTKHETIEALKKEKQHTDTITALGLMDSSNVFLLRELTDTNRQRQQCAVFFENAARMSGLRSGLRLAMDELLRLKLDKWSSDLARQGNQELTRVTEINSARESIEENLNRLGKLHTEMSDKRDTMQQLSATLNGLYGEIQICTDRKTELVQMGSDECSQKKSDFVPLPHPNSGVTGLIGFRKKHQFNARFTHFETTPNVRVTHYNSAHGTVDLNALHMVSGQESARYLEMGVSAFSEKASLPEYQASLMEVEERLNKLQQESAHLRAMLRQTEQEMKQIIELACHCVTGVRESDQPENIIATIDQEIDLLEEKFAQLKAQKTAIDAQILANAKEYKFLCDIADEAELKNPEVITFMSAYMQYVRSMQAIQTVSLVKGAALFAMTKPAANNGDAHHNATMRLRV